MGFSILWEDNAERIVLNECRENPLRLPVIKGKWVNGLNVELKDAFIVRYKCLEADWREH